MLEVHAPNHRSRKSRYRKALKTRSIKCLASSLGQRPRALDQVQQVPIAIGEEYQSIPLIHVRLAGEAHALGLQSGMRGVEIGDFDGEVAEAGVAHFLIGASAFGGNDLQHGTVGGAHEKIAVVLIVDAESQMIDVPFRKLGGRRRSNGGVFQTLKHNLILTAQAGALSVDLETKNAVGARW